MTAKRISDAKLVDTLQLAKQAQVAGFNQLQAEFYAESLAEVLESNIATKQDIKKLEHNLKMLEYRLLTKFGTMLVIAVGVLSAIIKL